MGQKYRLSTLHMGVTRHNHVKIIISKKDKCGFNLFDKAKYLFYNMPDIQTDIQGYLVIPASPGVKFFTDGPDLLNKGLFHKGMNVFITVIKAELSPVKASFYCSQCI